MEVEEAEDSDDDGVDDDDHLHHLVVVADDDDLVAAQKFLKLKGKNHVKIKKSNMWDIHIQERVGIFIHKIKLFWRRS